MTKNTDCLGLMKIRFLSYTTLMIGGLLAKEKVVLTCEMTFNLRVDQGNQPQSNNMLPTYMMNSFQSSSKPTSAKGVKYVLRMDVSLDSLTSPSTMSVQHTKLISPHWFHQELIVR
jgi:hypothetical protein